jgi:RNA polymerase sigma factor (TIGR02999 family)
MNDEQSNLPAGAAGRAGIPAMLAEHYGDLRSLAERQLLAARLQGGATTLSPTSLLGETFTKLLKQETKINDRNHLAAIATMLFVRILADRRRRKHALKRGGGKAALPLDAHDTPGTDRSPDEDALLAADVEFLHEKLAELAEREPRRAEALSLHVIGGLTVSVVADLLKVSVATVERDVALARAWLASQLKHPD